MTVPRHPTHLARYVLRLLSKDHNILFLQVVKYDDNLAASLLNQTSLPQGLSLEFRSQGVSQIKKQQNLKFI